jgi:hypothetical protein
MDDQGAKKVQGYSWLCIKNEIHVFTPEQILPRGREATDEVLGLLFWDMMDHKYGSVESVYGQEDPKENLLARVSSLGDCSLVLDSSDLTP